jgi:hypothetical protein
MPRNLLGDLRRERPRRQRREQDLYKKSKVELDLNRIKREEEEALELTADDS